MQQDSTQLYIVEFVGELAWRRGDDAPAIPPPVIVIYCPLFGGVPLLMLTVSGGVIVRDITLLVRREYYANQKPTEYYDNGDVLAGEEH